MFGAYAKNYPQTLKQPNGTIINCFVDGDEYYSWLHDANNYTIVQNTTTGYYCYAMLQNNDLIASTCVVGVNTPSSCGLTPGINLSSEQILSLVSQYRNKTKDTVIFKPIINNTLKGLQTQTINNIVVYIRFADQTEFPAIQANYESDFNSTQPNISSMSNYFNEVSYGALNIHSTFYPNNNGSSIISYQDNHTQAYYRSYIKGINDSGYTNSQMQAREDSLLSHAFRFVKNQIDPALNIDIDNNTWIDVVNFIIRGEYFYSDPNSSAILWPHAYHYNGYNYITNNIYGKKLDVYVIQLENYLAISKAHVLCHEMYHALYKAPDLYHYTNQSANIPVGIWDIMSSTPVPPQHMGAYMKSRWGHWIDSIPEIRNSGTYSLNPITSANNNCYKIKIKGSKEFIVLEYRKKAGIFESSIPNSGLLIYRINPNYNTDNDINYTGNEAGSGPGGKNDIIYIYRPNGNLSQEGNLLQANFTSDANRSTFSNTSNPANFLSNGLLGNIYIKNIGSTGNTITFDVRFCDVVTKTFTSTNPLPTLTNASQSIGTTGLVTVNSNNNVTFEAAQDVTLGNGFEIKLGGVLEINMNGCGQK